MRNLILFFLLFALQISSAVTAEAALNCKTSCIRKGLGTRTCSRSIDDFLWCRNSCGSDRVAANIVNNSTYPNNICSQVPPLPDIQAYIERGKTREAVISDWERQRAELASPQHSSQESMRRKGIFRGREGTGQRGIGKVGRFFRGFSCQKTCSDPEQVCGNDPKNVKNFYNCVKMCSDAKSMARVPTEQTGLNNQERMIMKIRALCKGETHVREGLARVMSRGLPQGGFPPQPREGYPTGYGQPRTPPGSITVGGKLWTPPTEAPPPLPQQWGQPQQFQSQQRGFAPPRPTMPPSRYQQTPPQQQFEGPPSYGRPTYQAGEQSLQSQQFRLPPRYPQSVY